MPFEGPLCPARRCVRDGGPGFVAVVRVCGLGVGVYLCAPVFPCVGVGPGGDQELLVQLRRKDTFLASAALLCCAVLCLKRPGPWAPLLGMVWRGVADGGGGGDLLSRMDGYGEGGALTDDEGPTLREGEPAPRGAAVVRKSPAGEACAREYL